VEKDINLSQTIASRIVCWLTDYSNFGGGFVFVRDLPHRVLWKRMMKFPMNSSSGSGSDIDIIYFLN